MSTHDQQVTSAASLLLGLSVGQDSPTAAGRGVSFGIQLALADPALARQVFETLHDAGGQTQASGVMEMMLPLLRAVFPTTPEEQ